MDDCNPAIFACPVHCIHVQIPLWTIVTRANSFHPWLSNVGSDSSMDDCNPGGSGLMAKRNRVQIPLWTIVTQLEDLKNAAGTKFRFLYGRL